MHGISTDSIYRHLRSHEPLEARAETPETVNVPVAAELVERLIESADDLRRARRVASLNGNILGLTRASDSELRVLVTLIDKLGITNTEVAEDLRNTEGLVRAVASLTNAQPEIGKAVAAELAKSGFVELSSSFMSYANAAKSRIQEREVAS